MDKEKEIPTAEQFFRKAFGIDDEKNINECNFDSENAIETAHEYAVLFAKWHVKECKEAIKENAELYYIDGQGAGIDEDSIENAYKEENIK